MKNPQIKSVCLFATITLATTAVAVSPPPDGGYANANTAEGQDALFSLTTGTDNTAMGFAALYSNSVGNRNSAYGSKALYSNTGFSFIDGSDNTAIGYQALFTNTTGSKNTANGVDALRFNTTGSANAANGYSALISNTTGSNNTATGFDALFENTTGAQNTGNGVDALFYNTTGSNNTATGSNTLFRNTGSNNTATGASALYNSTTGADNTAIGAYALVFNRSGSNNTATGISALGNNTYGSGNIALGNSAGSLLTTGNNNIDIGNVGVAAESRTIRIGTRGTQTKTFIAGISGVTVASGVGVIIDTNGQLGTVVSSERFKDSIKPMDKTSEAILSLQPVTFRYKHELDPKAIPQFGLVAEQVAQVDPDLVARDAEGKPYTVRYEAVNAMLLNEFLKEHRKGEQQDHKIEQLEATVAQLQIALKEQAAQIEKVSDQLGTQVVAPLVVANN